MGKSGFTLIELLVVISIVAVASAGSIIVFDKTSTDTNMNELTNKYLKIQRTGLIYIDVNDPWRKQFNNKGFVQLKLFELQNENYVDSKIYNDLTYEEIDKNSMVIIYSAIVPGINKEIVDTCLVSENFSCLANSSGGSCNCCQYLNKNINGNDCL